MSKPTVEFLLPLRSNSVAAPMLQALKHAAVAAGHPVREVAQAGRSDWLVLFGVGAPDRDAARVRQIARGGHCIAWDHGYVLREKKGGHLRLSINDDHPWRWFDATPPEASRWDALGVPLREDADPVGPIILVGMGTKSRVYLKDADWEQRTLGLLEARFPGRTGDPPAKARACVRQSALRARHRHTDCRTAARCVLCGVPAFECSR